ncbi:MAG: hypothetical protein E7421_04120 [Ruminococcaceae bacterium]|nr:hypothetical protein [Oscillospiraceae bacterium]
MMKISLPKRLTALLMTVALMIGLMPTITLPAAAATLPGLTVSDKIADHASFDNWKDYYGTNSLLPDGTRGISTWKAGGVWTNKSVYNDSDAFPSSVTMDNEANNFLVALSALASTKEIVGQSSTPTDSFLVLDVSGSMDSSDKAEGMVEAANRAIHSLMAQNRNNRVGVMLYSGTRNDNGATATTLLLPLDHYTTTSTVDVGTLFNPETIPAYLTISDDTNSPDVGIAGGVRNANSQRPTSAEREVVGATYIQRGLYDAWKEFEKVTDIKVPAGNVQAGTQRSPVIVLMSDGRPTLATDNYNNVSLRNSDYGNGTDDSTTWESVFLTQLTAAWVKGAIANHYGTDAKLYTLGLGTSNDRYATGVLNPDNTNNSDITNWWSNFQTNINQNGNVLVEDNWGSSNDWYLTYDTDRFAVNVGRSYSDGYWSADDVEEMITAFQEIIAEIGLQSAYSATLVEKSEANFDGYITVQDELGSMMQVKDIKGILLGSTLFSGEEMAKSLNTGALGDANAPTAYGDEFVLTVKERLGLTDKTGASGETITATAQAQQLIQAAYMDGQLSYNTSTGAYSNYIGWYGDENNAYLGFWDKDTGLTATGAPTGAKYINRSYGYLGGASTEEGAADMMHIVVMVRTEIVTGHQTVLFRIPSSLIPMVEYKVELEGDSLETATNITLTVTENDPIRLVYEVGLPDDVNSINIDQKVKQYLAKDGSNYIHKDANGNYIFYANGWDDNHDDVAPVISDLNDAQKLELTKHVAESHFVPNTVNERFYVLEDSVVYTKNGNDYTPVTSGIDTNTTYYFPRTIVTVVNGTAQAMTQYEQLHPATVANTGNFQKNDATGYWEIKAGTVRQQLSNVILPKTDGNGNPANLTDTLPNTDQLWVNVVGSNPSDFNVYSFLGNNGKLTITPTTGIKVTKDVTELANGAAADEKFPITVTVDAAVSDVAVTDVDGVLLTGYSAQVVAGKTVVTLQLADGESAVISNLPAGVTYTVAEAANEKYTATYTGATATVANTITENLVTNEPVRPGSLYITKEVVHAHEGETFPTDYEFQFKVTFVDASGNPIADTFQLENNYDATLTSLATDANGVMTGYLRHGETVYIKDIPAGATVTVEEVPPADGNHTLSGYRSRNFSGDTADTDGVVTITSGRAATVVVTNTYTPKETSVQIDVTAHKTLLSDSAVLHDVVLGFAIEQWDPVSRRWNEIKYKEYTWNKGSITQGTDTQDFAIDTVTLGAFTEAGVYTYRVVEAEPASPTPGLAYDKTVHTIVVTVTDMGGQLVATVADETGAAINDSGTDGILDFTANFTNKFDYAPVSIEIVKAADNQSNTPQLSKGGFDFAAFEANPDWSLVDETADITVTSDSNGSARMTATYNTEGVHRYVVKELPENKAGWTAFSDAEYRVTVNVAKDLNNNLAATMTIVKVDSTADSDEKATYNGNSGTIIFRNTYRPDNAKVDLNVIPTVRKELNGRDLKADEFTFAIFKNGEAAFDANGMLTNLADAVATGANDASGNVTFAPAQLTFSQVDKYEYDVVEVKGTLGGVTYDTTVYDLVVEVTDDGNSTLKAEHYFEDSVVKQVTFHNTYSAKPTSVVIEGAKRIQVNSGVKLLNPGDYTFQLFEADAQGAPVGNPLATTANLANGTFQFDAIAYTHSDIGKTFRYVVLEKVPAGASVDSASGKYVLNGVTYSDAQFIVEVTITDNGDGTLKKDVAGNGANAIQFVNTYESRLASVTLSGTKELDGRSLQDGEYSFVLHTSNAAFTEKNAIVQQNGADSVANDANGEFTFKIENLGMGYHYYILSEVIPDQRATGIHYDANVYHITVQVSDSGNGQMGAITTVVHSGQPNVSKPPIVFRNVYSPEPGELPLSGSKTYNGGKALENDVFSVGLYDASGLLQTAQIKANGSFAFENLQYTAADVGFIYTYTIKEIIPDGATDNGDGTFTYGQTIYDGTVYTLEVAVKDEQKDGVLEVESVLKKDNAPANEITFTNTFVPTPVTHTVIAKKTYEKGLRGGDFQFKLTSTDGKTNVNQTKENAANGDIVFDAISFAEAGEYKFKLVEKIDNLLSFILPSIAEYEITVTVVNENGVLRVSNVASVNTMNTAESNLEFINIYLLDGKDEITIRGTKKLTGDRTQVNAEEFAFGLYDANGNLVESVRNDANGNFAFKPLEFDETDVPVNGSKQITYTVQEIAGSNARYTYDDTIYTIVVTVKDNDQGGVTASYTVNGTPSANAEITFTNVYSNPTPVTYTPLAKKNYNKALIGGEFKFTLEGSIGNIPVSQEKTNAAGGSITFDTLSFPEAGIYTFTVKEIDKLFNFIQYSAAEYTLVVTVVDTNGVLSLGTVTVNNDPNGTIAFTNTYTFGGEEEITLRGKKVLTGGRTSVNAGEFEFGLYDAAGNLVESVKNDADGNFAFKALKFDETDIPVGGSKQITYTVKEIAGSDIRVTYDQTVYTVVVTVKDNDQGGITASYTVNGNANGAISFTNVYTPKPEDITVDFNIIKTVVNKGGEKIGPEGFEFLLDTLADGVADTTVKTDSSGKAKFTLNYTEDDVGNTYTYKLTEVNGGKANVTYSDAEYTIQVTIGLNGENKLFATLTVNGKAATAVSAAFENVYDYTVPPQEPQEPQNPQKPPVENPKTGDSFMLQLWVALMFVSGGVLTTTLCIKKKQEAEN